MTLPTSNRSLARRMATPGPAWIDQVKRAVDERLGRFFEEKRAHATALADDAVLVDALATLTMRGGKRLRPAVLVAAFRAVSPDPEWSRVVPAGAALELLQSYLLIHDDWMDGDAERRGGPSVHAALRAVHEDAHLADSLAILSGDMGSACAWELMLEATTDVGVLGAFVRMHQEVVLGQQLDLVRSVDVSRMQRLKTGSYTVDGPLRVGALLGRASHAQLEALERFARPLGEAFQLRDDLLGTFGDTRRTGKPIGGDLRAGKRTALVREAEAQLDAAARAPLDAVLGRADASADEVEIARRLLETSGARERVEARLDELLAASARSLANAPLAEPGVSMLCDLVAAMGSRDR